MRRLLLALCAVAVLGLTSASGALAQYGGGPTTTSPPTTEHGYGPPGGFANPALSESATKVAPGGTVSVSSVTGPCAPGTTVPINLIRVSNGSTPILVGTATVGAN